MNERARQRNAALLLGLTAVIAGFFTWRAGQIGSNAAFADRSSIGQTMQAEQRNVEAGLGAISDALVYVRYAADYAEAAALDEQADLLDADGRAEVAETQRRAADELRLEASADAASADLFGRQSIYENLATSSVEPLPFDFDQQVAVLTNELNSGIATQTLDPDAWAHEADEIRIRIRGLRLAGLVLLVAIAAFTVVQVSDKRYLQYGGVVTGSLILLGTTVVTVGTVW